jgi:hypothetical protein
LQRYIRMPNLQNIQTLCAMFMQKPQDLVIKGEKYDVTLQLCINAINNQEYALLSLKMHKNEGLSNILYKISQATYSDFHVTEENNKLLISYYTDINNISINNVQDKLYLMEQILV